MELAGILVHSETSRERAQQEFPGIVFTDLDEFLSGDYDFVMTMVPGASALQYNAELMRRGIPVLSETPPGMGVDELNECYALKQKYDAKIQVTEQCHLRPYYQAVLSMVKSGALGKICCVHMGILHDYHAMSIIRQAFGISFENAVIDAREYHIPVHYHCGREGLHAESADNIIHDKRVHYFFFV